MTVPSTREPRKTFIRLGPRNQPILSPRAIRTPKDAGPRSPLAARCEKCRAQSPITMTNETNAAIGKLERIQRLWRDLGRTKTSAPEYEILLKKIRTLSAEYELLPGGPRSSNKQNN
jgi:hypothetical protein